PYAPAKIPATAYKGAPATRTAAVPNVLLARNDLPDELVYAITDTMFTHTGAIDAAGRGEPDDLHEAWHINVRTGISTASVPLHPGAAAWVRDRKHCGAGAQPTGSVTASAEGPDGGEYSARGSATTAATP